MPGYRSIGEHLLRALFVSTVNPNESLRQAMSPLTMGSNVVLPGTLSRNGGSYQSQFHRGTLRLSKFIKLELLDTAI